MCCGKLCKEIEGGQCEGGSALEVSLTSGVTRMAWRCGPKHVKTAGHGRLHAVNVTRLLDSHLQRESSKRPWGPSRWCNLRSRDINALQFFYCDNFLIIGEIYSIFSPEGLEALIFSLLSVRVKSDKDPTGVQEQCRWIFSFFNGQHHRFWTWRWCLALSPPTLIQRMAKPVMMMFSSRCWWGSMYLVLVSSKLSRRWFRLNLSHQGCVCEAKPLWSSRATPCLDQGLHRYQS